MVMTQGRIDNLNLKYAGTLSNRMAVPEQQMLTSNLQSQTGAEARLAAKIEDTQIAVARQAQLAEIAEKKAERIAQIKADVSLQKDLKQQKIFIAQDGRVNYTQELFSGKASGDLSFCIDPEKIKIYWTMEDTKNKVLSIAVKADDNENIFLAWVKELGKKKILDRLGQAGVNFHFRQRREREARMELLQEALRIARYIEVPEQHGWYRKNSRLFYAEAEELTWKEIMANV